MNVTFVGLGVMGYPMAGYLQMAGHRVCVYNRTAEKARNWVAQYGGQMASTVAGATSGAELVCVCVGNDDDLREVILSARGILAGLHTGAVIVDHTTASAEIARELEAEAALRGVGFLDAPVSGGQAGAENGTLTVMVGGDAAVYDKVQPVLAAYSRCTKWLGPSGAGQLAKMVNQICIAGVVQGLAEGMAFGERAGLDIAAVIEVISQGAAQSWQMDNRHESMLAQEYDHGFAVDLMRKDLGMVLAQSGKMGLDLPVTALVDQFYAEVQEMGGRRWDTSSLFARMQRQG